MQNTLVEKSIKDCGGPLITWARQALDWTIKMIKTNSNHESSFLKMYTSHLSSIVCNHFGIGLDIIIVYKKCDRICEKGPYSISKFLSLTYHNF